MNQLFHHNILFVLLLLGVSISSCQQETFVEYGQGNLCITLADGSATFDTKAETERPVHYNAELSELLQEHFRLKVVNSANERVAYEGGFQSIIPINEGSYSVTATYGTNEILAWSAPYFVGETDDPVEVEKQADSPVLIICTQQNAMASINFGENDIHKAAFDEMFEAGYGVEVQVEDYKILIESGMSGRRIYYRAGSNPTFTFRGQIKNGPEVEWNLKTQTTGTTQETINQPGSYAAASHLVLTLALKPVNGAGLIPTITLAELKKETINNTIPLEWLPKPKIAVGGDFQGNVLSFMETESKSAPFTFDLASKFQDLKLTFEFEDPQFSIYNKTYLLSDALQNETDRAALSGIFGVELTTLDALGDLRGFDLGSLVSRLQTNYGTTSRNKVMIDVKANDRWSSEDQAVNREFVLECKAPTLTVLVQDYNVWAKSFTIDECQIPAVCDVNKIKQSLVYQYSTDGTSWHDCNNGRSHTFKAADGSDQNASESFPAVKNIQVRALHRSYNSSNKLKVTLENPAQVPNWNMDAWTESTRPVKITWGSTKHQPIYYPWVTGSIAQWWDTNNNESMLQEVTAAYLDYKCFPTTSFESPGYGGTGKAAVIRSVSTASANSEWSGAGKKRGILYVGTTDYDGNRTEGQSWASRPTHLAFHYKYDSYDNERFGAYIELYNGSTLIANGQYLSVNNVSISSYSYMEVPLSYSNTGLKATSIKIRFYSVADGDEPATRRLNVTIPAGTYKIWGGSVLTVDNIQLIYAK